MNKISRRRACLTCLISAFSISVFVGCAAMVDSAVRTTIEPAEKVIEFIDSCQLNKDQIYDRTLLWATQTYNSSKTVIDLKDREAGIVSIKATMDVQVGITTLPCKYSIQIRMKDHKAKMTLTVLQMQTEWGGYPPKNSMLSIHSTFAFLHGTFVNAISNQTNADDF